MTHALLRWICAALFGALTYLGSTLAAADGRLIAQTRPPDGLRDDRVRNKADDIYVSAEPGGELSFSQIFPRGNQSVVRQKMRGTAHVLRTAHRAALADASGESRSGYRRAVVCQAAARRALADRQVTAAMYLTIEARSLGRQIIRASATRVGRSYRPDDLRQIQRAGGVRADDLARYVHRADAQVPPVWLLFQ